MLGAGLSYGSWFESEEKHKIVPFSKTPVRAPGPSQCIQSLPTSQKTLRLQLMLLRGITCLFLRAMRKWQIRRVGKTQRVLMVCEVVHMFITTLVRNTRKTAEFRDTGSRTRRSSYRNLGKVTDVRYQGRTRRESRDGVGCSMTSHRVHSCKCSWSNLCHICLFNSVPFSINHVRMFITFLFTIRAGLNRKGWNFLELQTRNSIECLENTISTFFFFKLRSKFHLC
jgi:hypothetical protein